MIRSRRHFRRQALAAAVVIALSGGAHAHLSTSTI